MSKPWYIGCLHEIEIQYLIGRRKGVKLNMIFLFRHYIFRDGHKFDVVFDAGGRVSLSLTTVTATSQLMWPADFLQSPTIASKVMVNLGQKEIFT